MPQAKKLIEVALPLDAINRASAREKSIRHGHPSTLHLWWARRPLAAARAVIFTSLVDDPDDPNALPAFVEACKALPGDGPNVPRAKAEAHKKAIDEGNDPASAEEQADTPRMRLFDFIERLVTWEATTDEKIMGQARELIQIATKGNPPPLLDPFAGGGSIPLEAQRLGLEAHASDLNPVAVMINKAMIEIPPRFAGMPPVNPRDRKGLFSAGSTPPPDPLPDKSGRGRPDAPAESRRGDSVSRPSPKWKGAAGLAADVRYYGEWMRERAFERIGHLYPKLNGETVIAWLWARTVISPNPAVNAPVPLVRSFALSKKKGRECWAKPVIAGTTVRFEVTKGLPPRDDDGTVNRRGGKCIVSGEPMAFDYIRAEGKDGRMGAQLMAIVTEGKRGRSYYSPAEEHVQIAESAVPEWKPVGEIPEDALGFRVQLYGINRFSSLYSCRQLKVLTALCDTLINVKQQVRHDAMKAGLADNGIPLRSDGNGADAYVDAIGVYLAFLIDKGADFWSRNTTWIPNTEAVGHTFVRHTLSMVWDYTEANPFSTSSGSLSNLINGLFKVFSIFGHGSGQARQENALSVQYDGRVVLSTDPPYYDNIGYADLSDYFYVWIRRNLRGSYPDIFSTVLVPRADELIASAHRHGGSGAARERFEQGMLETFTNLRAFVRRDFPISIFYAFKQQDAGFMASGQVTATRGIQTSARAIASTGWETMLTSLIKSGFEIVGTWPMRTERSARSRALGSNALASSIVLVCRPRPEDAPPTSRRRFLDALRAELPGAIAEMKTGSIAPVDMAQATIGPGMAIYSRYSAVLEADGTPLTVRTALGLINAALDEVLAEQDADLDAETRFAIGWFEERGFQKGDFGQANVLAQAKNTAVASVALAGVVVSGGGKVRLINWREYDPGAYDPRQDKRPTVWEGTHHLIERLNHHGEMGAAALYNRLPGDIAESVRDLAYRLYHICDRKGWAEDALDYNALVSSWSEITRLAASERGRATQADLFEDNE